MEAVNRLVGFMEELAVFVPPLAHGDLSAPLPSPDNAMAAPFVELHAHLSRLTWQVGEIARGDYAQRVDFMGAFSRAVNSMVAQLAEREERLTSEIERRHADEVALQRERDLLVAGPVVTFRWDIDDEGTVRYVSPNNSDYGYTPDELLSGHPTYGDLIHPDDLAWVVEEGTEKTRSGLFALGEHLLRSVHRHKSGMGVVFLDLDGLASINERFGHDEDNRALRALAEALKASIRESDVLARVGGDEFVVLVEDDAPAVEALAERVRRRIAADNARPARRRSPPAPPRSSPPRARWTSS